MTVTWYICSYQCTSRETHRIYFESRTKAAQTLATLLSRRRLAANERTPTACTTAVRLAISL